MILAELKISETRDSVTRVNDHKVIFVDIQGAPIDKGALKMKEAGKLPHYEDLMLGRARLNQESGKYIVPLLVKEDRNIPIMPENLLNSLRSLLDVVNEKQLMSFSISKGNMEEIPWQHTIRKLKEVFMEKNHNYHHLHWGSNHPTSGSAKQHNTRETRIIRSGTLLLGKHEERDSRICKNL